jgi:hypothetical protein
LKVNVGATHLISFNWLCLVSLLVLAFANLGIAYTKVEIDESVEAASLCGMSFCFAEIATFGSLGAMKLTKLIGLDGWSFLKWALENHVLLV